MSDNPDIAAIVLVVPDIVPGPAKSVLEVVGSFAAAVSTSIGAGPTLALHKALVGYAAITDLPINLNEKQKT